MNFLANPIYLHHQSLYSFFLCKKIRNRSRPSKNKYFLPPQFLGTLEAVSPLRDPFTQPQGGPLGAGKITWDVKSTLMQVLAGCKMK